MSVLNMPAIFNEMLSVAKNQLGDAWTKAGSVTEEFITSNKDRLTLLAELRASGDLDNEGLLMRLQNEKDLLEVQLNALKIIAEATVQNTVNGMMDVLVKAAGALIP